MKTLKWRQVNAWRLAQQGLSPRLKRKDFVKAVTRTGGIQAQVMSAAEMALWARVEGLGPEDVQTTLWRERTLVKTWAMRGLEKTAETIQLLPLFDAYTIGIARDIEALLPKAYKRQVFRPQGWISAVVMAGGRMKGVWEYGKRRSQSVVKVQMFSPATARVRRGIEAEVERLGAFLNTAVALEYGDYST